MPRIDVNGLDTYYEVHGDGPPLMLLHGGYGNAPSMEPLTAVLSRHYRVYLPERRGHGQTPDPGEINYRLMTEDTAGFMRAMGIEKARIVGYSDGAIICFYLGIEYPEMVERMVPISGNFHWNGLTPHMRAIFEKSTPEALAAVIPAEIAYYREHSPDGPEHFDVVFEKLRTLFLSEPTLTVEDLAKIKAPTLVLAADRDLMPIDHTIELHKAIEGSQLCIVPGANHALVFDRAEEVCTAVLRFLTG
jgi:pimeloyl-ACP methyl ester carboxylesterase